MPVVFFWNECTMRTISISCTKKPVSGQIFLLQGFAKDLYIGTLLEVTTSPPVLLRRCKKLDQPTSISRQASCSDQMIITESVIVVSCPAKRREMMCPILQNPFSTWHCCIGDFHSRLKQVIWSIFHINPRQIHAQTNRSQWTEPAIFYPLPTPLPFIWFEGLIRRWRKDNSISERILFCWPIMHNW